MLITPDISSNLTKTPSSYRSLSQDQKKLHITTQKLGQYKYERQNVDNKPEKHGARAFQVSNSVLLIKQTVKKGQGPNAPYVIDDQKEHHVDINDDTAIANGIRDAVKGKLAAGKKEGEPGAHD